jgi:hypothetical protein
MEIRKGMRIRARWFDATRASLAGMQAKVGARLIEVQGVVRHVRGDHPTAPTTVGVFVETEDGRGEVCDACGVRKVAVDLRHVVEVDGA